MGKLFACLGFVLAFAAPARAAVLYVDDDAPAGGDGTMARPFASLQTAIDAASNGDDIQVADGTYEAIEISSMELHLSGSYSADFAMRSAVASSVISGTPSAPAVTLFETASSVVDGFVIRGGQRGVVIDADFASTTNAPEIRNNIIEQNGTTSLVGGGISAEHCDARFIGNTVRDNVGDRGPGIAVNCRSVLIEGNIIEGNLASGDHGGGLYLTGTTMIVRGNLVRNNEVGVIAGYGWGAGVVVYNVGASVTFERNVFTGNLAQSVGGGAFIDDGATATFDHDLFYANRCGEQGGAALYVNGYDTDVSSHASLVNVTIAGHRCEGTVGNAVYVEDQSTVDFTNSIVWDNGGDDFVSIDARSTITATYTLSEEPLDGTGNLSADPLFFDPAAGDFHVRSTRGRFDPATATFVIDTADSPTIDVGDPAADYAMEPGPNGMRINLGHTGNTPEASMGGPGGMPPPPPPPRDAGTDRDAASSVDGGPGLDAGLRADASLPDLDASGPRPDAGPPAGGDDDGCGCRISRPPTSCPPAIAGGLLLVLFAALRRRSGRQRAGRGQGR